jgi:hypothetical protein
MEDGRGCGSRRSRCFVLSIDHDLKRSRNDCPSSNGPFGDATLPLTFSTIVLPTFSDLIVKVIDLVSEPSA